MVEARYLGDNSYELTGLSTDKKPLTYRSGTPFREIDTGKVYRFDGEHKTWGEVPGGGDGDDETASEDDINGIVDGIWPEQT